MEPTIDPTTGGLKFVKVDKEENLIHRLKNIVSTAHLPKELLQLSEDINALYNPQPSLLHLQDKIKLVKEVGEEIVQAEELEHLFKKKPHPICYDGFEPSGRMHIAQGVLKAINVNKLVDAGCIFVFWVADWFAKLNNKMDGDLDKIKIVGQYFIEIWRALGMKMQNVKFLWASDEINRRADEYWLTVMDIAAKNTISRIKRCATIMGRNEQDDLSVAQMLYPCMQCTDIFFLQADICQLGMDQRKVNMLAREYCDQLKIKDKPIIVSHHMLMGMKEGQEKMSKSDPFSAIFMEDSEEEVNAKVKKAYCPPNVIEKNPLMDYLKHIIFQSFEKFEIQRLPKNGGDITYKCYADLEKDYANGLIHPDDLKKSTAKYLNILIQPVRDHFKNNPRAQQILKLVQSFKVTK